MTRLSMNDARCEALFASGLQRSDSPTAETVAEQIGHTVRLFGVAGCAGRMAQEFGDHPEAAADRMRWARQLVGELFGSPFPRGAPLAHVDAVVGPGVWAPAECHRGDAVRHISA